MLSTGAVPSLNCRRAMTSRAESVAARASGICVATIPAAALMANVRLEASNPCMFTPPYPAMQVGVAYDSDIDHVERVLLEIGIKAVAEIPGMAAEPAPSVTLDPGFAFRVPFSCFHASGLVDP